MKAKTAKPKGIYTLYGECANCGDLREYDIPKGTARGPFSNNLTCVTCAVKGEVKLKPITAESRYRK